MGGKRGSEIVFELEDDLRHQFASKRKKILWKEFKMSNVFEMNSVGKMKFSYLIQAGEAWNDLRKWNGPKSSLLFTVTLGKSLNLFMPPFPGQ